MLMSNYLRNKFLASTKCSVVNTRSQKGELMRRLRKLLALLTFVSAPAYAAHQSQHATKTTAKSTGPQVQAAYKEMQENMGIAPDFFKAFPAYAISGAWEEDKNV